MIVSFRALFWIFGALLLAAMAVSVGALLWNLWAMSGRSSRRRFPRERGRLLGRLARMVGGEVVDEPGRYRYPFLRAGDFQLALATAGDDPGGAYVVRFEAPVEGGRFVEAWPKGSPFPPLRMTSGLPEVTTGDTAFDTRHIVRADDTGHARAILSAEVREGLGRIGRIGPGRVRFDLHPRKLVLQKEEAVGDAEALRRLGEEFRATTEAVRRALADDAAVEFVDTPLRPAEGDCPVCGSEIAKGRVLCRRCRTPHHRECWDYVGTCSTFACGEDRWMHS